MEREAYLDKLHERVDTLLVGLLSNVKETVKCASLPEPNHHQTRDA